MKTPERPLSAERIARGEISVSVIVPAYNAAQQITPCLRAILASNYPPHEIIVVDDCSTDRTAECAGHLPCRLVRTPQRSGPAAARTIGIGHARAEMLLFIDSDIIVRPDTIRMMLESFAAQPGIASVTGDYDSGGAYHNLGSLYQRCYTAYKREFLPPRGAYINTAIFCIPPRTMDDAGGFRSDIYTGEDYELGLRLTRAGYVNYFNRAIKVTHNKRVSVLHLLRQKMQYAVNLTMVMREASADATAPPIDVTRSFAVAADQMLAVGLSWPAAVSIAGLFALRHPGPRAAAAALILGYCAACARYWLFLFRFAGPVALLLLPIAFMEHLIAALSVPVGWIRARWRLPYWKHEGIR
jgi:GT2 family glycosyltransferase